MAAGISLYLDENLTPKMASSGIQHAGIIFGIQTDHGIGDWVKALELICLVYTADDMKNHVEYL